MLLKIHRGSREIGGTVIELATENTKILLDAGLPLSRDSKPVDIDRLEPDAVFISHPHKDHFGLIDELNGAVPVYIGELGRNLIDATRIFLGGEPAANSFQYLADKVKITVGDFTITPYLVDHSAVDAYSFLVEVQGKRVFYSGDFRAHGRKSVLFDRLTADTPADIDALLMEGTMINRNNDEFPNESTVEDKIAETIKSQTSISFLICSSQNIDRIVSAYRACKKTNKQLVVDFYTAWVLEKMRAVSQSVPHIDWEGVRFYADFRPDQIVKKKMEYFGDFRKRAYRSRVTKEELQKKPSDYLMLSKMSKYNTMDLYKNSTQPVNVIYSQWLGYLKCSHGEYPGAEAISAYQKDPEVNFVYAHTSGHAVLDDLKRFAQALAPRVLIPVHTENGLLFKEHFPRTTILKDSERYIV